MPINQKILNAAYEAYSKVTTVATSNGDVRVAIMKAVEAAFYERDWKITARKEENKEIDTMDKEDRDWLESWRSEILAGRIVGPFTVRLLGILDKVAPKPKEVKVLGWDAVNDMRQNPNAKYRYRDIILKWDNTLLYIYPNENSNWHEYSYITCLNNREWVKVEDE
jgi:hypothetical protein